MLQETVVTKELLAVDTDVLFAIIVYDIVPEFMPHRAFRRAKHYKTRETKSIKCPHCSVVLWIVEATARLELLRYPKKDKTKVPWHKSMLCNRCNNMIGIIYHAA